MKTKIVEAMIADGYNGLQIADFEKCWHTFKMVMVFKDIDLKLDAKCVDCGCDSHAALMMGLNPENYTNDKPEDFV